MTLDDIEKRIDEIRELACRKYDDEAAHIFEDALFVDVLKAVAAGAPNSAELARYALKSQELEFARWCA